MQHLSKMQEVVRFYAGYRIKRHASLHVPKNGLIIDVSVFRLYYAGGRLQRQQRKPIVFPLISQSASFTARSIRVSNPVPCSCFRTLQSVNTQQNAYAFSTPLGIKEYQPSSKCWFYSYMTLDKYQATYPVHLFKTPMGCPIPYYRDCWHGDQTGLFGIIIIIYYTYSKVNLLISENDF